MATPIQSNTKSQAQLAADSTSGNSRVTSVLQGQGKVLQSINDSITADKTRLSGLGKLQSALFDFQKTLSGLSPKPADSQQSVDQLVAAYNKVNASVHSLASADLKGDKTAQHAATALQQLASLPGLNRIGLKLGSDGSLSVDKTKLQGALNADAASVTRLVFEPGVGVAARGSDAVNRFLGSSGELTRAQTNTSNDITSLTVKGDKLSKALDAQAKLIANQYSGGNGSSNLFDMLA